MDETYPFPLFSPGLPRGSCGASNIFTAEEEASHADAKTREEASLSVDSDAAPKEALADATNGAAPLTSPSPQKELFIDDMPPSTTKKRRASVVALEGRGHVESERETRCRAWAPPWPRPDRRARARRQEARR